MERKCRGCVRIEHGWTFGGTQQSHISICFHSRRRACALHDWMNNIAQKQGLQQAADRPVRKVSTPKYIHTSRTHFFAWVTPSPLLRFLPCLSPSWARHHLVRPSSRCLQRGRQRGYVYLYPAARLTLRTTPLPSDRSASPV